MNDKEWRQIIDEDFESIRKMLNNFEVEVRKLEGPIARQWVQPLRDITFEALYELLQHRNNRIDEGDQILNNIKPDDNQ